MRVKLIIEVGEDYMVQWIDLPFVPAVDMQIELATSREQAAWTRLVLVEIAWHVTESCFECDCYAPMCQDYAAEFWLSRGWEPIGT